MVEDLGKVITLNPSTGNSDTYILTICSPNMHMQIGDLVAVNGVCLTVKKVNEKEFDVHLWQQTVAKTNLGLVKPGDQVNLELNKFKKENYLELNCQA